MSVRGDDDGMRWAARPALARVIRVAVFAAPVAAAVGVSSLAHLTMGAAGSRADQAWHLAVLLVVSTATLILVDRVVRRALPLATLLELSMLFPDRAPSRIAVAREAIRKRPVEDQLARVRDAGADPAVAAREILGLVAAMRLHDRPTRGHAERVRLLTDLVAQAMSVPARDRDLLRWAAILHDIGKLRVSPAILNKPGKPTDEEWALLRAHPAHGAQIAGALLPWLGEWGDVIVQHHEKYDGTGYPGGLAGREISLGGRIVAVADAYEVMTAARAYRRPVSRVAAHRELVKWSGQQFDPAVVRAMVGMSAPRLRRAQGVIAWLSDIPLVATGYVPAATMARVVGVGALATGAAAGLAPPAMVSAAGPPGHSERSPVSSVDAVAPANPGGAAESADSPGGTPGQPDQAAAIPGVSDTPTSTVATPAAEDQPVDDAAGTPKPPDPARDTSGSGSSGSDSSGSGRSGSGGGSPVAATVTTTVTVVTTAVDDVVTGVVVAVTGVVGAVTGAASGSASSGSGSGGSGSGGASSGSDAVTGTVDDTVGTVTGVVGGLLGGGKRK